MNKQGMPHSKYYFETVNNILIFGIFGTSTYF
jgi:hypothetical protein